MDGIVSLYRGPKAAVSIAWRTTTGQADFNSVFKERDADGGPDGGTMLTTRSDAHHRVWY